jgi:FlaA1/EpsC-like NDP-sugar epimerase
MSRDEHKQYELQQQLVDFRNVRYLIGDVRDSDRLERAMQDIDFVFHAAAMKHVPACEYNPFEAVKTNVLGTQNVIQASIKAGVKKTIFTSTDKAISPTNTYGASKLMAERLIASAQSHVGSNSTVFAAVRFGNILGSRGSVVPLFKWQILNKGYITVTDTRMSRFMMTLTQATKLTLEAAEKAQGGEIFVLKMPVINLGDLAEVVLQEVCEKHRMKRNEIEIREIGLRPGEKMYEELMTVEEARYGLELPHMFILPNMFLNRQINYDGAVASEVESYNSHVVQPISRDEVTKLLIDNEILDQSNNENYRSEML